MFTRIPFRIRNARALRSMLLAGSFLVAGASFASAQSTYFALTLSGASEVPPNTSTATGGGCLVLDQTAHKLFYSISFSGLAAAQTDAHIHCCAPAGMSAGVMFPLPLGSPISGFFSTTPTQENNILNGLAYVNIHSGAFPNGEIRGQLIPTPIPAPLLYCFGDGTGTACPCGNASPVGASAGCLNSFAVGGTLRASGVASIGCDNVALNAANLPASTSALFFQGTTQVGAGAGAAFGDGLRCAGGSVIRLATATTSGGAATYPAVGQPLVHVRGAVTTPGTRTYQTWYRNAAAFCQPETFNLTNGVQLTWVQ
jgi:hypothetical protein